VTEYIRLKDYTFTYFELTTPLYTRLGYFEKLSNRRDGVIRLNFVFHNSMLFVKMKITSADVISSTPRRHKHHHLVVALLTLFISINLIDPLGIIRYDTLGEIGAVSIGMIPI
jgi:hypothetical protein